VEVLSGLRGKTMRSRPILKIEKTLEQVGHGFIEKYQLMKNRLLNVEYEHWAAGFAEGNNHGRGQITWVLESLNNFAGFKANRQSRSLHNQHGSITTGSSHKSDRNRRFHFAGIQAGSIRHDDYAKSDFGPGFVLDSRSFPSGRRS
jgi:hypothetical protein